MKRQNRFDYYRPLTISMFIVELGLSWHLLFCFLGLVSMANLTR